MTGVEISPDFVAIEQRNARKSKVRVDFLQGIASAVMIPLTGLVLCWATRVYRKAVA